MVIQCSECQTRFKLADDKMKPGGIKVRCAKCKHVFTVVSPKRDFESTPATATLNAPAERAETSFAGLQDEDFSLGRQDGEQADLATDDTTEDSFGLGDAAVKPIWDDFSLADSDDTTPETSSAPTATSADDFDLGPSLETETNREQEQAADDFEFSPEGPGDEEDFGFAQSPAAPAVDEFDFGVEVESTETEDGPDSAGGFELEDFEPSSADDDFSFGDDSFEKLLGDDTVGEFLPSMAEEEAEGDFDSPAPPTATTAKEVFDFGAEDDSLEFADLDNSVKKSSSWADVDSDAFGDDFDLAEDTGTDKAFDFPEMSFQEEAQVDHLGDDDFGSIPLQSPSEPEPVKSSPTGAVQPSPTDGAERAARPNPPLPTVAPPRRGALNRLVLFVLGLLLTLLGAAGYFLWQSGGMSPLMNRISGTTPAPMVNPQIRLTGLNGYFVTSKDAGQLFVIQGQAINEYPEIRSAITVKGALYDKGGKLLVQQTVFCGNHLDDTALQELPFAKISEAMNNQFGDTLSNLNVAPGKTIPFTIVFRNFPPELAEFTVESVDSRPGSN